MADSSLITFRTMAQMLKIAVMPEILRRFSNGQLTKPFYLRAFRFSQRILPSGSAQPVIELNDEIRVC
jgi:hypothetical protein